MVVGDLTFLKSKQGQTLLAWLAEQSITPHTHLTLITTLRKQVSATQAADLLETALLRQKGMRKFTRSAEMFFTRAGLEMSSSETVSRYRAGRMAAAGCRSFVELGCGIGGDSIGMAAHGPLTAVEMDRLHLEMAAHNTAVYGFEGRFTAICGDLRTVDLPPADALFFDPGRRDERGKRIFNVNAYQPPLNSINHRLSLIPNAVVKVSPGINYQQIPAETSIEFISLKGGLREALLWYGDFRPTAARTATLLPHAAQLDSDMPRSAAISEPRRFLLEPDAAVIRAHLVQQLAAKLSAARIDTDIAYLTADVAAETPFGKWFRLDDWFPFGLKRLKRYLREKGLGRVTIHKRGSPIEPDWLQRQLKLKGTGHRHLFLTRVLGQPAVIICQQNMLKHV